MRSLIVLAFAAAVCGLVRHSTLVASAPPQGKAAAGADCVTIGKPKPSVTYVVQHTESTGRSTQLTNVWESVTDTGSRVRIDGPTGVMFQVNEHHIADDVAVIDKTTKLDANGRVVETTTFRPGVVGDPAFRACAGRSWSIPPATATYQSPKINASATSPAGTLKIISIRERITVPAGTFEAVRYVRTSQSTDEYWKSIDHGVILKHIGTLPTGAVTDVLIAIR